MSNCTCDHYITARPSIRFANSRVMSLPSIVGTYFQASSFYDACLKHYSLKLRWKIADDFTLVPFRHVLIHKYLIFFSTNFHHGFCLVKRSDSRVDDRITFFSPSLRSVAITDRIASRYTVYTFVSSHDDKRVYRSRNHDAATSFASFSRSKMIRDDAGEKERKGAKKNGTN